MILDDMLVTGEHDERFVLWLYGDCRPWSVPIQGAIPLTVPYELFIRSPGNVLANYGNPWPRDWNTPLYLCRW